MADRRAELERKKLKLAQIRAEKDREKQAAQTAAKDETLSNLAKRWDIRTETDKLLASIGFSTISEVAESSSKITDRVDDKNEPVLNEMKSSPKKRVVKLSLFNLQDTNIPPKESVTYDKQTQTSGSSAASEREAHQLDYYVLTYDDHNIEEDGDHSLTYPIHSHAHHREKQPSISGSLPNVEMVKPAQTSIDTKAIEEAKPIEKKRIELTEEEKLQILTSAGFDKFFNKAVKIIERALYENEPADLFVDYSGDKEVEGEDKSGALLSLNRCFYDDRWSKNRTVTSFDWSSQYPELLLASYNNNEDSPNEPDGVCLIWNMKFKQTTPEYVFHCQSPLMSACFAKFHPNLILGGTYSGQIVLWDNRTNKRTPVQRSPLSASAHTHPIYCMQVVGTQNAHNLITVSTDGKLCSWSLDMLTAPQYWMDLQQQKQSKPVSVTSISFLNGDYNNFIIGSEEGVVYSACRHGTKAGILDFFEGHQGPITNVDCHAVQSQMDFSHLFLTSSIDWTVKLWSTKESKHLHSFEDNCDYVYDARWSPIHPALFATANGVGRVDLWNLNNDTELPTASVTIDTNPALNRLIWTPSGHQLAIGDDAGKIWIYDVGEIATPKSDESTRLMQTLQELKNNNTETENMNMETESSVHAPYLSSFTSSSSSMQKQINYVNLL